MQGLETLTKHVSWGNIDYLVVDTPPGTGDTLLSLVQNLPITGIIDQFFLDFYILYLLIYF